MQDVVKATQRSTRAPPTKQLTASHRKDIEGSRPLRTKASVDALASELGTLDPRHDFCRLSIRVSFRPLRLSC